MKRFVTIFTLFALMAVAAVQAQEKTPDWKRWHYLSEEEMNTPVRNENFVETDPPTGTPRFVAEFEPMQGVMIRYPLGIPTSLVAQLSNNCQVYCIVSSSYQSSAQSSFQNAGVNMNNVTFVNAASDSYWVRDYGPWYIFEDRHPAIVDNIYNRPRPNDDNMSGVFANYWNIPMYGMNLEHTGGNMMEDGRGHGVSDELVFQENNYNETNVRNKMRDYLGIDPYHVTIDPQGDYIAHVDCWGKYLAPDKILIAQLPSTNSQYALYEQVAEYFATTNCCWGYPYHVYRVQEPGGYTLAPYTNSLILNKTVYVPLGSQSNYNQMALQVYQEAMPGYEIVGVTNNDYSTGWENTDALHCRTRGVMDFNMLFVDHREVLHGEQEWQEEYPVVSKFIAYSGMDLKQDSLLVYYSINGGEYQVAHMTATGNPDEYVGNITGFQGGDEIDYYVFGADESGHRYTQPVFAELDPHHFTVGDHALADEGLVITSSVEFELNEENPQAEAAFVNGNYNSLAPIEITNIYEVENPLGEAYLMINPEHELPYSLSAEETFHFALNPNVQTGKGTITTFVFVESSDKQLEFMVTIDENVFVSVTEISAETKLYPNPTNGIFTVESANMTKVEVYNLVGQMIYAEQGQMININANDWNKGIYLVNITMQNGAVETKKLVVR
jgi:agmatine/peptidylarginine deiminase